MKLIFITIFAFAVWQTNQNCVNKKMENATITPTPTPQKKVKYDRLPANITLETEVRRDKLNDKGEVVSFEIVSVEERLNDLKARYKKNVLVDGKGKEIRFFEPLCRGVSAGYERDRADQKAKDEELAKLKKKYTVIILYCNPAKVM
jgi:hypothetical protein